MGPTPHTDEPPPLGVAEPIVVRTPNHTWRFVWSPSDIPLLVQTLAEMTENPLIDFDAPHAMLVIYELGRRFEATSPRLAAKHRSEAPL